MSQWWQYSSLAGTELLCTSTIYLGVVPWGKGGRKWRRRFRKERGKSQILLSSVVARADSVHADNPGEYNSALVNLFLFLIFVLALVVVRVLYID